MCILPLYTVGPQDDEVARFPTIGLALATLIATSRGSLTVTGMLPKARRKMCTFLARQIPRLLTTLVGVIIRLHDLGLTKRNFLLLLQRKLQVCLLIRVCLIRLAAC